MMTCSEQPIICCDLDDGAYLWCPRCGWSQTLGDAATVDDAVLAEAGHTEHLRMPLPEGH